MRGAIAAFAAAVTLASVLQPALAQERQQRSRQYEYDHPYRDRSSTEDRQGRCQRDNGRSIESLDLRKRCDREEYWARIDERRK